MNADGSELDRELDRLVDGELSPAAYCELLKHLEQVPGGWRRCALAFLQAQAWGHDLSPTNRLTWTTERALARDRECDQPDDKPLAVPTVRCSAWMRRAGWATAWAASLIVAMWLGRVEEKAAVPSRAPSPAVVVNPPTTGVPAATTPDTSTWTVVVDRGWQTSNGDVALPLYDADAEQARRYLQTRSRVPQDWEQRLRASGRSVRRSWQYSTLQLPDGRDAVIPIEQIEIVPITVQAVP